MSRCYDDMFRDEIVELLETAQAESDRRLALLRKIVEESILDVEIQQWDWQCTQEEFDELADELK